MEDEVKWIPWVSIFMEDIAPCLGLFPFGSRNSSFAILYPTILAAGKQDPWELSNDADTNMRKSMGNSSGTLLHPKIGTFPDFQQQIIGNAPTSNKEKGNFNIFSRFYKVSCTGYLFIDKKKLSCEQGLHQSWTYIFQKNTAIFEFESVIYYALHQRKMAVSWLKFYSIQTLAVSTYQQSKERNPF